MSGKIGSTSPRFVPFDSNPPKPISAGKSYFVVKIHAAQADFFAPIWQKAERLVVTSSVSLNHPILGNEPLSAIHFTREVQKGVPQKLGSRKNLIDFVPAMMTHVSISVNFILDMHNRFADLSTLINTGEFVASATLGPGAALAAKTVSGISQKIVSTLITNPDEQKPILQFEGDFDISTDKFCEGYYVILGSNDQKNLPLPEDTAILEVTDTGLLIDGKSTDLSYIILSVSSKGARTRDLNEGAAWDKKLREAEAVALDVQCDSRMTEDEKNKEWAKCKSMLKEAHVILINDDNYLREESDNIYRQAMTECGDKIFGTESKFVKAARGGSESTRLHLDLESLGVSNNEDLESSLNKYAHDVAETKRFIKKEKIREKANEG